MTRVGSHKPFLAVLALAVALRAAAMLGYPSTGWFGGDSGTYLEAALNLKPSLLRPSGYSVLLWSLLPFHSLTVVAGFQHLLGLATGVMLYALVWRGARTIQRPWLRSLLGAAAAAPVLLDAYQLQLEHLLMADELFIFLAVAAVTVIMWPSGAAMRGQQEGPGWKSGAVAGVLLAFAALTRSVGLPFLLILIAWLVVRRVGPRVIAVTAITFAVPMLAYLLWFKAVHKTFELTRADSIWLYGRAAAFADCAKMKPPPELRQLCVNGRLSADAAVWGSDSGLRGYPGGIAGTVANARAAEFAWLAVRTQPLDYLEVVLRDTARAFAWNREPYPSPATAGRYAFPVHPVPLTPVDAGYGRRYAGPGAVPRVVEPYASWVRGYQSRAYLPGTLFGVIMAAGLAGIIGQWRRWGGQAALPWLFSAALLVVPAATADFDYRYVLPAVPFACLAAALTQAARAKRAP